MNVLGVLLAALAVACSDESQSGLGEGFRVRNAQFIDGDLPGHVAPKDAGPSSAADGGDGQDDTHDALRITAVDIQTVVVYQGQGGKKFSGRASLGTASVGIALDDVSTGYWIVPTGLADLDTKEPTWSIAADFGDDISPGNHNLLIVAIDKHGKGGVQTSQQLCIGGRVHDNLHACVDSLALPRAVIALTWDANSDLDLQVVGPKGHVYDAKHLAGGKDPIDDALIDRDSNAACVIDGVRAESLVWNTTEPHGTYGIYVNMYDSCKQPTTRFHIEIYTAIPEKDTDGGEKFKRWFEGGGELLDISANAGKERGLFVTEFKF